MNTPRRRSEQEVEQIDKVNAVGKSHARIVTGTLEAAESRSQHLQPAKSSLSDCIAHPQRRRVEPENMADLQNQSVVVRELCQLLCLARNQRHRFFHEHIFPHAQQFAARFEVRRRRRNDHRSVNLWKE
jgi:hypothetical protein